MDLFLRTLTVILLFFVPFAFAGAEPWAFSVLQTGIGVLLVGLFISRSTFCITPLFKPVLYILGLLIGYTLLQCLFTQTLLAPVRAYPATLMRLYSLEHVSYFVTYLAWVFVCMQLADTSVHAGRAVTWIGVCAILVALCALGLYRGEYFYLFTGKYAGYGPFFNRNHGGLFLAAGTVLCLGWVCSARFKHAYTADKKSFIARQIWAFLAVLVMAVAAVFSRSRGGILALTVGLFVFCISCAYLIPSLWKKRLLYLFLTVAVFSTLAYWAATHVEQINAFAERRGRQDASIEIRQALYRAGGQILHDYPVWGIGVGAMPVAITSYVDRPVHSYIERLHNDWLELLIGLGYVGGILVLVGILWFMYKALRRITALETAKKIRLCGILSSLTVICVGAMVDFPFFIPATALLFFSGVALACSASLWKGHIHNWQPAVWMRVLLVLLFLAACFVPLQKTRAWRLFVFGHNLKAPARLQYYEKGLSLFPSPHFAIKLGNAYYNASLHTADPQEKFFYYTLAHVTAVDYLNKYPKDKELSVLYFRTLYPTEKTR